MKRAGFLANLGVVVVTALVAAPAVAHADEYDDAVPLKPLAPASATPPAPPPAPSTAIDTVQLRNGTVYRGQVLEIQPNSHVSVAVPGEGTKRVAWADVEKVIVASYTGPLPPTTGGPLPYVAPSTPPLEAPMKGPLARVHIHAKTRVILYRRPAGTESWTQACTSPCDVELPIGDGYRLTGNGVPQTKEFKLAAPPGGAVEIDFDPPSTPGMLLGGTMAYGGAFAAYVGLLVALASSSSSSRDDSTQGAGLLTLAVGSGVGALGLVIFLNSATTDIEQKSSATRAAAAPAPRLDAFLRTPTWKGAGETATPASTFPLVFSRTF